MARIFTAGNELGYPLFEGFYGNGTTYVSVSQRGGYRSTEQNGGEWYYYLPQNYVMGHHFGTIGEPTFPTSNAYTELYLRFHLTMSTGGVSGERSIAAFTGADGSRFFTVTIYDSGGSGTDGNPYGVRVRQDFSGTIWASTGAGPINNQWSLIEVRLKLGAGGTGAIEIRVNEVVLASTTGSLLGPSGQTTMSGFGLENYQISGSTRVNYYDNVAVNDTTGTVGNSWPGQGYTILRVPQRDGGTTQLTTDLGTSGVDNANRVGVDNFRSLRDNLEYFTPSAIQTRSGGGSVGTNYPIQRKNTGFVRPTAVPQKDTYTVSALPFDAGEISGISLYGMARSQSASVGNIRHLLKPQAQSEIQGGAIPLPSSVPEPQVTHFNENPNTGFAFTSAEVNDIEIGMQFES